MREIKFEFIYKRKTDGFINKLLFNMNNDHEAFGLAYLHDGLLAEYDLIAKRQYTGLKDKNGVEIYEGDICRAKIIPGTLYVSEFKDGSFLFREKDRVNTNWIGRISNTELEVIGNIYENPELLEHK